MTIPAKRRPRAKIRRGRSHLALKGIKLSTCPQCGKPILPHHACGFCGYYKGREVVKIKSKLDKAKKEKSK